MNKKFIGMLGLARKARKVILGYDNIVQRQKSVILLIMSESAVERTKKNVEALNKPIIVVDMNKAELGYVLGAGEVSVVAVIDDGIAKQLTETAK